MIIVDSILMDIMILVQSYKFAMFGTTFRWVFAMIIFYAARSITQQLVILPFPKGNQWNYPGFFSIYITYGHVPDFCWSGHIGGCTLNMFEFWANGEIFWAIYSGILGICTFFMMIFVRGHYSTDMISGFIIAHFTFIMMDKYIYLFDWYILGIPLK